MAPSESHTIISVEGLRKRFGRVEAVAGISFEVRGGEIFGFLGPNGAGKTTTINLLTGLARPDAGTIRIAEVDCSSAPKAAQHLIGVVPDESNLYPELTGFENLCFCGALYGMRKKKREEKAEELLSIFDLQAASRRPFKGYSKGMKRKLTIAAGIIHDPPILFLDEPTTGIDVQSARRIRRLILELNRRGTTIFLTTHYIEEAERLCRRIAFIVEGRIVRSDTIENLLQPALARHAVEITCRTVSDESLEKLIRNFPDLSFSRVRPDTIRAEDAEPIGVGPLVRFLEDEGAEVMEARRILPSLEEVFVHVTGIEAEALKSEGEGGRKRPSGAASTGKGGEAQ